jgi:hypothetical protein
MPILSLTPPTASSTENVVIEEKCLLPCKHNGLCLKIEQEGQDPMQITDEIPTSSILLSFSQNKTTSLVSRNENDYWVDISDKRLRNSRLGALYDGSRFKGVQKCGTSKYNVLVDIQVELIVFVYI